MVCPFIDKELKGCAEVLNVNNVDLAMELCADNFVECEVFNRHYRKLTTFTLGQRILRKTTALYRKKEASV